MGIRIVYKHSNSKIFLSQAHMDAFQQGQEYLHLEGLLYSCMLGMKFGFMLFSEVESLILI